MAKPGEAAKVSCSNQIFVGQCPVFFTKAAVFLGPGPALAAPRCDMSCDGCAIVVQFAVRLWCNNPHLRDAIVRLPPSGKGTRIHVPAPVEAGRQPPLLCLALCCNRIAALGLTERCISIGTEMEGAGWVSSKLAGFFLLQQ